MTRRILATLFTIFCAASSTMAANFYVDPGCSTNGNNSSHSTTCGATGPANSFATGLAAISAGDHLYLRGSHSSHSGCASGFDGIYRQRGANSGGMEVNNRSFASETFMDCYGYTSQGAGTQETCIQDGFSASATWTQCTTCGGGGDCPNINGGAGGASCTEVFKTTTAAAWAQTATGGPTYRVTSAADLSNAHAGYIGGRCSGMLWKPCSTDTDCKAINGIAQGTCTAGAQPERDAYSDGTTLYVRWGTLPASEGGTATPGVVDTPYSGGIWVGNGTNNLTIRGMNVRNTPNAGVDMYDTGSGGTITQNFKFIDGTIFFTVTASASSGYCSSAYGMANHNSITAISHNSNNILYDHNEVAFTCSEALHTQSHHDSSAINIDLTNNYVHDVGNTNVTGTLATGTPQGIIISDDYWGTCSITTTTPCHNVSSSNACNCSCPVGEVCVSGNGDYTGSEISGNVIDLTNFVGGNEGNVSMRLENAVRNSSTHDNIFKNPPGRGFFFACEFRQNTANDFYNNLIISPGFAGIDFMALSPCSTTNNKVFNNTIYNPGTYGIDGSDQTTGTITDNLIENNILYSNSGKKMVNWTAATGGTFDYNLVFTSASPAITWLNTGRNCGSIDLAGANNVKNCSDPLFVSASTNDFHIQTGSPAKDLGTSTSLPTGKTRSINNPIASLLGYPQYNGIPQIGSAWDMGAVEYRKRRYYNVSDFKWKRPEPWTVTNAAFLRLKKEIEN